MTSIRESGRVSRPERCAFCHDALDGDDATCEACGTVLHRDCFEGLGECPTLGCAQGVFTLRPEARARVSQTRPAFRQALARWESRRSERPPPKHARRQLTAREPSLLESLSDRLLSRRWGLRLLVAVGLAVGLTIVAFSREGVFATAVGTITGFAITCVFVWWVFEDAPR